MKRINGRTNIFFVVGLIIFSGVFLESGRPEVKTTLAQSLFQKLLDGKWVYKGTGSTGVNTKSVIQYSQGPGEMVFSMTCENYVDDKLRDTMMSTMAYHPGKNGFVFMMVGNNHGLQEGEELESSEMHIVFDGTAYHTDGIKIGFFWKIELIDSNTFIHQLMVFEDGVWKETKSHEFKRIYE